MVSMTLQVVNVCLFLSQLTIFMLSNFNESLLPVEFGNLKNCAMIYTLLLFTCIENLLLTDKCAQIPTSCYCKEKH